MEKQTEHVPSPGLPLPVLTGTQIAAREPQEWQNAPRIVRDARLVNGLGVILCLLGVLAMVLTTLGGERGGDAPNDPVTAFVLLAVYGGIAVLLMWLIRSLKRGLAAAWTVQMVLSILGLLGFPLGTIIHGMILSRWFQPETKAWFGLV